MPKALHDRFWSKVQKSDACWLWTAHLNNRGYGSFAVGGRAGGMKLAHRVAYEMAFGPIADGLVIDHLCNTPACVRPDHLRATTQRTNVLRGSSPHAKNASATHCKHGHEFTESNTHIDPRGHRRCRACKRRIDVERRARLSVEHFTAEGAA